MKTKIQSHVTITIKFYDINTPNPDDHGSILWPIAHVCRYVICFTVKTRKLIVSLLRRMQINYRHYVL